MPSFYITGKETHVGSGVVCVNNSKVVISLFLLQLVKLKKEKGYDYLAVVDTDYSAPNVGFLAGDVEAWHKLSDGSYIYISCLVTNISCSGVVCVNNSKLV